jgi:hypothetical protein
VTERNDVTIGKAPNSEMFLSEKERGAVGRLFLGSKRSFFDFLGQNLRSGRVAVPDFHFRGYFFRSRGLLLVSHYTYSVTFWPFGPLCDPFVTLYSVIQPQKDMCNCLFKKVPVCFGGNIFLGFGSDLPQICLRFDLDRYESNDQGDIMAETTSKCLAELLI